MDLKPGYKQTEVGVIPNDWAISTLEAVVTKFQNGYAFPSDGYVDSGVPIITMAQIGLSGLFQFDEESVNYWPLGKVNALKDFVVVDGDIIVAMTDVTPQKNLIGRMACVDRSGPFLLNQRVGLLKLDKQKIDSRFIRALSNSSFWRSYSRGVATLGVQANIGTKELKSGKIPLPPIVEQRIISTVLSDIDALLDSLDRLIAKKRDLKQAAMQQLLTGQTRLPGFSGEWEVKRLGDIAFVSKGAQLKSELTNDSGKFAHLNGGITPSGYTDKSNTDGNTIAISEGGNSCGFVQFMTQPYWCGGHCYSVMSNGVDNQFLYQALKGQQSAIMGLRVGSGLPNVQKTGLLDFKIRLPASEVEQTAIADVLTGMDDELMKLDEQRNKTAALKQGMMQELLTGRTRLV